MAFSWVVRAQAVSSFNYASPEKSVQKCRQSFIKNNKQQLERSGRADCWTLSCKVKCHLHDKAQQESVLEVTIIRPFPLIILILFSELLSFQFLRKYYSNWEFFCEMLGKTLEHNSKCSPVLFSVFPCFSRFSLFFENLL